jgi:Predicted nucleotidyltransferases
MIPFREEIEEIKNQITHLYNPYEIILFGSCAKGRAREDSDIDICIVLDFQNKRELLIDLTMKIESSREVDFIVYTKSSWEKNIMDTASFASLIKRTGVKIYG